MLPDNMTFTKEEMCFLLGYSENDIRKLDEEGWIQFSNGGYHIHPLVKEVVHLDLKNGKAPLGTAKRIVERVISGTLITNDDVQQDILHKLSCAEGIVRYIRFVTREEEIEYLFQLGMAFYQHARRRLSAIRFIEKALALLEETKAANTDERAAMQFQLGYIKSTSHQYRKEAKYNLREALCLWESLGDENMVAMAKDHLGYVLTDHSKYFSEAKQLLQEALDVRGRLLKENGSSMKYRYDYSTTCDNLGFLLMRMGGHDKTAESLLRESLAKREELYATSQAYGTDVAWSAFNLAKFLSVREDCRVETESLYNRALSIRREMESMYPDKYKTNIVFTLVNLAKFLSQDITRYDEVVALVGEAIDLKNVIDSDRSGFFSEEIESDLVFLEDYILKNTKSIGYV